MRLFSTCLAVGSLLFALVTAPLFHAHDRDEHGTANIHAHLPEFEIHFSDSGLEIEAQDSHHRSHSIDVFTSIVPSVGFYAVAELSDMARLFSLQQAPGTVCIFAPRAHGPPDGRCSIPRSPPAI